MAQESVKEAPKKKINLAYLRDKDRQMVRGKFNFFEVPGGSMSFVFRGHKGDDIKRYDFLDGEIYSIPLGVAKHLNNDGWYPQYGFVTQEQGVLASPFPVFGDNKAVRISKKVHRYSFQSLEFVDVDDLPTINSQIVTVESI